MHFRNALTNRHPVGENRRTGRQPRSVTNPREITLAAWRTTRRGWRACSIGGADVSPHRGGVPRHFAERLLDLAAVDGQDNLLDVACGRGRCWPRPRSVKSALTGIDLRHHDQACGGGPPRRGNPRRRPPGHGRGDSSFPTRFDVLTAAFALFFLPTGARGGRVPAGAPGWRRRRRVDVGGGGRALELCGRAPHIRGLPGGQGPAATFRPRRGPDGSLPAAGFAHLQVDQEETRSISSRSNSGGTGTGCSACAGFWNSWSRRPWSPIATGALEHGFSRDGRRLPAQTDRSHRDRAEGRQRRRLP